MVPRGLQTLGVSVTVLGWLLVVVACSLPAWKVTAFVGADVVTWRGLWVTCVLRSTGQMQCKSYDSILALPRDLRAARGMTVMSMVTGLCGAVVAVIGGRCTRCMEDERSKAKACVLAGAFFIVAGLLCLVCVSWSAYTTIATFGAQKCDLGAALYVGWAAAALLLTGGGLLCCNCPPRYEHSVPTFAPGRPGAASEECV